MFFISTRTVNQGYRNRYALIFSPSSSCNFCEINKGLDFGTSERIF